MWRPTAVNLSSEALMELGLRRIYYDNVIYVIINLFDFIDIRAVFVL